MCERESPEMYWPGCPGCSPSVAQEAGIVSSIPTTLQGKQFRERMDTNVFVTSDVCSQQCFS